MTVFNYETYQTVFNSASHSWTPETAMQLFLENRELVSLLLLMRSRDQETDSVDIINGKIIPTNI